MDADHAKEQLSGEEHELAASLRNEIPFPLAAVAADAAHRTAVALPKAQADVGLGAWHEMEKVLIRRHPDWHVTLVPPVTGLPAMSFAQHDDTLDANSLEKLAVVSWALERWGVRDIVLIGHHEGKSRSALALSQRRIAKVEQWLFNHRVSDESHDGSETTRISVRQDTRIQADTVEIVLPAIPDATLPRANSRTNASKN